MAKENNASNLGQLILETQITVNIEMLTLRAKYYNDRAAEEEALFAKAEGKEKKNRHALDVAYFMGQAEGILWSIQYLRNLK